MMDFAINYSPEAIELISDGRIEVDRFKCPDWPETIAQARRQRPAYVHAPTRAGRGMIDQTELDRISSLLDISDTPLVNIHLSPCTSDFDTMPIDTRDPAHREMLTDAMIADVMILVDKFGPEKVCAENLMWAPNPPYEIPRPVLEPEVISRVVRQTGCQLILDLAHARVSAKYLGIDQRDYVMSLPVDKICELHVTGITLKDDGNWHDHYEMKQDDWTQTEWAIDCIKTGRWAKPWIMTFEYGGIGKRPLPCDKKTIQQQAPRLYDLAKSIK